MKNTPHQMITKMMCVIAITVATASCSKESKPAEPPQDTERRKLQFNPVDVSLKPFSDNKYETKPGCPWMPQETINNMTPLEYEMRWKVADYQHSTIYRCEVVKPDSKWRTNPVWSGTVTALKKDLTAADFKPKRERKFSGNFVAEGKPYAGESFQGSKPWNVRTADNWRCGKYLISYAVYKDYDLKPLQNQSKSYPWDSYYIHYRLNGRKFMKANVKQLCGTKTSPTKAVTDYPYIAWHSYRNSQATNPETYGVKKPADLKHIDFSPHKKARPTMTKKSPTSSNSSTP